MAVGELASEHSGLDLDSLRVLLVEDAHPLALRLMAFAFASNGCVVSAASTADEALHLLSSQPLDLVVADVELPGLSGLDLLRVAESKQPAIPVVLTARAASAESDVSHLPQQAYDYLRKPFSIEQVQQLLQRLRRERQQRSEGTHPAGLAEWVALRLFGVEGLCRIGDLALQGSDSAAFIEKALDHTIRGLSGAAALVLLHDEDGNLTVGQRGHPTLARQLLSVLKLSLEDLYKTGENESVTLNGNGHDFTALAAVIPGTGKPMGILCLGRRPEGTTFRADEIALLPAYARVIAVSLQKILLTEHLEGNLIDTLSSFVAALEAKDVYLKAHSARVSLYAGEIANAMGLAPAQVAMTRRAGILHDIGMLVIADSIVQRPGPWTSDESAPMREHPMSGAKLLKPLRFLAQEAEAIKRHHERYDGTGYPDGLKGEEIPLPARIIAVADTFDAMTSNRPYRSVVPIEAAVEEILRQAGTQFDPAVTGVLARIPPARLSEIARFYHNPPASPRETSRWAENGDTPPAEEWALLE